MIAIYIHIHARKDETGGKGWEGNASCRGMDDERVTRKVRYLTSIAVKHKYLPISSPRGLVLVC
jgi:hypothetical protein